MTSPNLSEETRLKIKRQIEGLKQQMRYDANDLEFETHLHLVKDLERLLRQE